MGSFFGHALPGTFFWIYGLWYLLNTFYYHIKNKNCDESKMKSTVKLNRVAFPMKFCCSTKYIPIEGIVKMSVTLIGMSVESLGFFWGLPAMYQHFTMYASFCISGFVDVLLFYDFSIPPKVDYWFHVMGFVLEGLLFAFHLHGRTQLDVMIHTLLVYVCYGCAISVFAMMLSNNREIFRIIFGIGCFVQGSWFWQAGQILYPITNTKWCEKCHEDMMLTVMIFCWHVIVNSLFAIILFIFMAKLVLPNQQLSTGRYQYLKEEKDEDIEEQSSELLQMPTKSNTDAF